MSLMKLTMVALAGSMAVAAAAQPTPSVPRDSSRPQATPTQLVLASAERATEANATTQSPEAQAPQAPAKRPRAARVTSCRCGDTSQ